MRELLSQYGLIAVFIGAIVEGDGTLLVSGVLAHMDVFRFPAVLVLGILGALVSDHFCYWLGRNRGPRIEASPAYARFAPLVERIARSVGSWEIVAARFVLGTRNVSMFFWGMRQLSYLEFTILDLIGCTLWGTIFTTLGYVFGESAKALMGDVKRLEIWLIVALVVAGTIVFVVRTLIARRAPAVEPTGDKS